MKRDVLTGGTMNKADLIISLASLDELVKSLKNTILSF